MNAKAIQEALRVVESARKKVEKLEEQLLEARANQVNAEDGLEAATQAYRQSRAAV